MIRQKVKVLWLQVISQQVYFDTITIINMQVFLLSDRVHLLIVQKFDIPGELLGLELTYQVLSLPIQKGRMSLPAPKKDVTAVLCHIKHIRPIIRELEVENVLGCLHRKQFLKLALVHLEGAFPFMIDF